MTPQAEDAVRTAAEALVAALVAAVQAEAETSRTAPDRLYSLREAAELLGGIARSTLYLAIARGELRTVKVGRRRLVPSSAIAEYGK